MGNKAPRTHWKIEAKILQRKVSELQEEVKTLKNPQPNISGKKKILPPTIKDTKNTDEQEQDIGQEQTQAPENNPAPADNQDKDKKEGEDMVEETLEVDEPDTTSSEEKEEKFNCPECQAEVQANQEKCSCGAELEWGE